MERWRCCLVLLLFLEAVSGSQEFTTTDASAHNDFPNDAQPLPIREAAENLSAELAQGVINAVDAKDPEAFASFLTEQCTFIFGNAAPVVGRQNIANYLKPFFGSVASLHHTILAVQASPIKGENQETGQSWITTQGTVTYTRWKGTKLTVPWCNVWKMKEGLIDHYQIYVDASKLYT